MAIYGDRVLVLTTQYQLFKNYPIRNMTEVAVLTA